MSSKWRKWTEEHNFRSPMPPLLFTLAFTFLPLRFTFSSSLPVSLLPTCFQHLGERRDVKTLVSNSLSAMPKTVYASIICHFSTSVNLWICSVTLFNQWLIKHLKRLDRQCHINTHTRSSEAWFICSQHDTERGRCGVGVVGLGVDVALITFQVEIVGAIDCASKCYTSHLSNFFLYRSPACHSQRHNCEC